MASNDKIKKLVRIIESPTKDRPQKDLEALKPLIRNIPLIQNNDILRQSGKFEEVLDELWQILTCIKGQEGGTVFKYGDYGDLFYVIIDGTVSVHVPMKMQVVQNTNSEEEVAQTPFVKK
jgi:hypothetical protein